MVSAMNKGGTGAKKSGFKKSSFEFINRTITVPAQEETELLKTVQ